MKDEEMAEEYARKTLSKDCCDLKLETYKKTINAFLAGLKAGRPQWHTPDVPTSPINKIVLGYIKDYNSKKFCLVKWNGEWWYDAETWNNEVKLIAWCETPLLIRSKLCLRKTQKNILKMNVCIVTQIQKKN